MFTLFKSAAKKNLNVGGNARGTRLNEKLNGMRNRYVVNYLYFSDCSAKI
jgi:hypothetical protein